MQWFYYTIKLKTSPTTFGKVPLHMNTSVYCMLAHLDLHMEFQVFEIAINEPDYYLYHLHLSHLEKHHSINSGGVHLLPGERHQGGQSLLCPRDVCPTNARYTGIIHWSPKAIIF